MREVPLPGHARHLQLAAPGGPVLVPAEDADTLVEVALPDGGTPDGRRWAATRTTPPGWPAARCWSGDEKGGTPCRSSTAARVTATLTTPDSSPAASPSSATPPGSVDVGAFTLTTYDVPAGRLLDVVDAGCGPTHLVADDRGRFLVADTRGDAVLVFSADPLAAGRPLPLAGAPYGLALDGPRRCSG